MKKKIINNKDLNKEQTLKTNNIDIHTTDVTILIQYNINTMKCRHNTIQTQ